ncbi:alpha/beta fold hydrolase [Allokutzneria albata]|uniref:Pimeloyl-ACP methyl ester carboxylesterase n=1 Tax=Allokutzneria albata TaxID=211114 RepID=A0A1G9V2D7_ALLAB|nr:alpha/beta hydrolase [Allokutzneria albata]SDM66045.1 Pimeloyl-ACP methyl ester carboxylesterase [Allokutzneria albata]
MRIGGFRSPEARSDFEESYRAGMRLLPEPVAVHDVPTGYGSVRVYRFGQTSGAPIVLLPGRAGTTVMWQPNIASLAERHPVYAVEPLGEPGQSTQTAPITSGAEQAEWLATVLEVLDLRGAHLVGVSFGGWLACNQALRRPERIASVSLVDPACTFARFPVRLVLGVALAGLRGWRAFLAWVSGGIALPEGNPVGDVIIKGMRSFRLGTPLPRYFTDEQLRSIRVPVLAIIAGRSVMHDPRKAHERARTLIPDVEAELWPTASHSLSAESPAEVNARILRFVAAR